MKKPPYVGTLNGMYQYNTIGAPNSTFSAEGSTAVSETGSFVSVNTPGFKTLKVSQRPLNPFTHTRRHVVHTPGREWIEYGGKEIYKQGYIYGQINFGTPAYNEWTSSTQADLLAKNKLLDRLRGSSVNLAQAFAERQQTVNMLAKSVNRLASVVLAIKKGKLDHAHNLLNNYGENQKVKQARLWKHRWRNVEPSPHNLANYWLEFSYGWRPLVSDIFNSCETLADSYFLKRPTKVTSVHRERLIKMNHLVQGGNLPQYPSIRGDFQILEQVRYVVHFIEDDKLLSTMEKTGLMNPLNLAWELIPYSFVVDWILPVGSYLQNLSATSGLRFLTGTKTITRTSTASFRFKKGNSSNGVYHSGSPAPSSLVDYSKVRTVLTSFPSPSFPSFRPVENINQVLSGISLIVQSFKRN